MDNNFNIKKNIALIQESEGETFEVQEQEIESVYQKLHDNQSSIAIKILSIFGGFFATYAFLGFLFMAGLYNSSEGIMITGFLFFAATITLNLLYKKIIITTISISAFVTGFYLVGFGLISLQYEMSSICLIFMLISVLTIWITKNYILSFLSIIIINNCIIYLIFDSHSYNFYHFYNGVLLLLTTYLFLNEGKLLADKRFPSILYNPVRIGLLVSLIIELVVAVKSSDFEFALSQIWISSIISIPLTVYVISRITKIIGITQNKTLSLIHGLSILVLIPTAISPLISGTLLVILLSFLVNYKTGLVIGIIAFVYAISQFYYDLSFTLLTKSIILFVSGLIFILFYAITHQKLNSNEKK
uniref:DUF4401 domain-containing protein n=1 Tax=Flavobacterium sp. TaxID=239 RepID=UPI00404AA51F